MTFINPTALPPGLDAALAAHPALHGLPASALQLLGAQARLHRYRPGEVLFHEGDAAQHWLLVVQGCVEVLRFDPQGEEHVFHCFHSGHSVAEAAMFMAHGRYPMTARTPGPAQVWRCTRPALHAACQAHPPLALRLLQSFSERLYYYINEVQWLAASSAPQRLAAYFLRLPADPCARVQLPSSQRQLATQLGIRPETLSRLLSQWQAQCWICGQRRSWEVLDAAPLRVLAGGWARPF
ncbi:Crp/Fnr family transcriptional regulator [Simplicispira psychrophila]|uniref:Crp/Fnr family transcriptional regulator n=1 Tax=Simplicispira psychrophila TaxID=80882 RepID=UPI000483CF50|nr:Crp/Fnr family transcriptional regulator [Simplicispira psychrophila]